MTNLLEEAISCMKVTVKLRLLGRPGRRKIFAVTDRAALGS